MSISNLAGQRQLRHSDLNGPDRTTERDALTASLLREKALLSEMSVLSQQQDLMAQEFDHRLGNSLQMIVSLLSLQSLAAPTPEAADQLTIAAGRVAAFGRVHRRLHFLDRQKNVEFKQYLRTLCVDIADLRWVEIDYPKDLPTARTEVWPAVAELRSRPPARARTGRAREKRAAAFPSHA